LDRINAIVVATPLPFVGGGGYRALLSIREYEKRGIFPRVILPWSFQVLPLNMRKKSIDFLLKEGRNICGNAVLPKIFHFNFPGRRSLAELLVSYFPKKIKIVVSKGSQIDNSQCVISMHEGFDSITTSLVIGEIFSLKRIVLLQLPPFYGDEKRIKNIKEADRLWLEALGIRSFLLREAWMSFRGIIDARISKNVKILLNEFDLILAVSKSIPVEMGDEWFRRVVYLDPGVALSQEDIQLINRLTEKKCRKEKIVIFGGRPVSGKGIVEALIAWRSILKGVDHKYKLVITGEIQPNVLSRLKVFCRKLDIENKVQFTGFLPRKERLSLVAKAKLMLYPSHVDAFPFAVLEALYLNTPVVAYDIPALRIYYQGLEGITLINESDLEALVQKSVELISTRNIPTDKPRFKSWNKIMNEETNLIRKLVLE